MWELNTSLKCVIDKISVELFINKSCILQQLKILQDTNLYQISQKAISFIDAVKQVSTNVTLEDKLPSNIITKNSWLKLSNENLVYGFTLQNTSKL